MTIVKGFASFFRLLCAFSLLSFSACTMLLNQNIAEELSEGGGIAPLLPYSPLVFLGEYSDSEFGRYAPTNGGDLNNDGEDDLIIRDNDSNGEGRIFVYSGKDNSVLLELSDPGKDNFAKGIFLLIDVNNDGTDDIITDSQDSGFFPFHLLAFSGADGSLLWRTSVSEYYFSQNKWKFEDVNSDGIEDIVTNAPTAGGSYGAVWMVSGADGAILWRRDGVSFGDVMRLQNIVEDQNSDGLDDLFVVFDYKPRLFSGADGTDIANCNLANNGGYEILGDVNTDGKLDFVGGWQTYSGGRGQVTVVSGADCSELYAIDGENVGDTFGEQVYVYPDVDSDGVNDLLVNSDFVNDIGKVYMLSGADGSEIYSVLGGSDSTFFFFSETLNDSRHDLNNDGVLDWWGKKVFSGNPQPVSILFSGVDGSEITRIEDSEPLHSTNFPQRINSNVDFDNDGYRDFVFSDANYDTDRGTVLIFSGSDFKKMGSLFGEESGEKFGNSIILQDLTGNGQVDFGVGSPGWNSDQGKITVYEEYIFLDDN